MSEEYQNESDGIGTSRVCKVTNQELGRLDSLLKREEKIIRNMDKILEDHPNHKGAKNKKVKAEERWKNWKEQKTKIITAQTVLDCKK